MKTFRRFLEGLCWCASLILIVAAGAGAQAQQSTGAESSLTVQVNPRSGDYSLSSSSSANLTLLTANVAAQVDGKWLHAADYPRHTVSQPAPQPRGGGEAQSLNDLDGIAGVNSLGAGNSPSQYWTVVHSGLPGRPDLICRIRSYPGSPFAEIQVSVHNTAGKTVHIEAIRIAEAAAGQAFELGGPDAQDRVLSDSFSEDRPGMRIRDLSDSPGGMHRAVGLQLVYNRQSHLDFMAAALTSDRFLTVLRLHTVPSPQGASPGAFEIDSTGTTELLEENSLAHSPERDRVTLDLPLAPGQRLDSERILFAAGHHLHRQLETYGLLIRKLHNARISAENPLGWWSWTAYYFGLNQDTALTNAEWLSQHLRQMGYTFFHIDEGYQYARGEYSTPDAHLFPGGVAGLERQITGLGLVPGIWTAPFEVSERSWVYQRHPDWLVHNADGQPIHLGTVDRGLDRLYALDTTNPGAQAYLRSTYKTMAGDWGIRYFKLDFMEDSAVEGFYYRPGTTALQAQRIGLGVIRAAVGDHVLLDKDGSEMLNPVGLVDFGRISQDTGHSFEAARDAASGIAARYYMNRNYFVADPDAFTVTPQAFGDQSERDGSRTLSLDEAKVSIALAAVSGGMFEIGDDLPTLGAAPDRLELLLNADLLDMVHLSRASVPEDLMSYAPEDRQPSVFFLHEDATQSMLTVFNWTDQPRTRTIDLAALGLAAEANYRVEDIFTDAGPESVRRGALSFTLPPHSVRMFKIAALSQAPAPLQFSASIPSTALAGEDVRFAAQASSPEPVLSFHWEFGDGVARDGASIGHAFTHPGNYVVSVTATGLDGRTAGQTVHLAVTGSVSTRFKPADKVRYSAP